MSTPTLIPLWHAVPVEEVVAGLGTDLDGGLSSSDAGHRLAEFGPNVLREDSGPSAGRLFVQQFNDVLVWLLLVAASVSGFLLGQWLEAGVILAIVILNAAIGFYQEYQAESALASLRDMAAPEALVIRDGGERRVMTADLVRGDVVVLEAGDRIPADARVVSEMHLTTDEAPLTGESFPVTKQSGPVDPEASTGDRRSMVFAGTSVAAGRGRAVVVATGQDTEVGRIADLLTEDEPPSPLTIELDRMGRRLAIVTVFVAVVIFGLGVLRSYPVETMFLSAVALAVAAIPEGLPAVVTVTLARGVQAMAREEGDRPSAPRSGGVGQRHSHLHGQDRDADSQRDEGPRGRIRRPARQAGVSGDGRRASGPAGRGGRALQRLSENPGWV